MGMMVEPEAILAFWYDELTPADWWAANPEIDRQIAERFGETHAHLALGEGFSWRETAKGRLAEIIVLDQFSRQLFRGEPNAFAQDGMALVLAQEAVAGGFDAGLGTDERAFLYMPFMHSESLAVHEAAAPLFAALGGDYLKAAEGHREVLSRFGRYPKRNAALGRESTPAEQAYIGESGTRMF
jgi:uncharacterized protein (DUF924 family)